ncbi:MAG: rhodanese-like domain-containing protein [Cyclobacteriaceae bacterium]
MDIEQLILSGMTVIDVRTPCEFAAGNASDTRNIPLNEIPNRLEEFKALNQPFAVCCQSGGRSGQAQAYLTAQGLDCVNAGSWLDVNRISNKSKVT